LCLKNREKKLETLLDNLVKDFELFEDFFEHYSNVSMKWGKLTFFNFKLLKEKSFSASKNIFI
jgi:hypothetical protein